MSKIKLVIGLLSIIYSISVSSQEFQGKAVYQTKVKMSKEFQQRIDSSKRIPEDRKAFFMKMMKKRMEKVYELNFTKTISVFKEQKELGTPSESTRFNRSANDIFFKDIKNKKIINKKETFGKIFLIKDTLAVYNWKLEKETKMIGKHFCLKATTQVAAKKNTRFMRFSKKSEEDSTKIKQPKMMEVTAWYTPEIPVNNGPKEYHGLPGLILEVNAGQLQILCTKIVLNTKEKEIIPPTKGTVITQKEYDKIMTKKMEEMRERFKNNRKKGKTSHRGRRH